jgi:hypothetical protein
MRHSLSNTIVAFSLRVSAPFRDHRILEAVVPANAIRMLGMRADRGRQRPRSCLRFRCCRTQGEVHRVTGLDALQMRRALPVE